MRELSGHDHLPLYTWESTYFEFGIFEEQNLIRQGSKLVYLVLESVGIIKTQGSHKSLC